MDKHEILSQYWGYDRFRPQQAEIIDSVLAGHDTLGLLPTGGGKSITFQIPALMLDGLTLVITPLVSLMKDQVDNLRERGIKALYLHSGLSLREHKLAVERCTLGKAKMLYVSPEKLQSQRFIDDLRRMPVRLIVVDEAHCISQWGYDFRPSYLKIRILRQHFTSAPILALTASATPQVVEDILRELEFRTRNIFRRSFARPNISYIVRMGENKPERLADILHKTSGSAIVYVRSRKRTREIADFILASGVSADFYHAGLSIEEKNDKQNRWKEGKCRVMVATNAFGMGIDKPDVRLVVHVDLPSSLEEYYQEAGRAGRDGKPSYAVVLAAQRDKATLTRRLNETFPSKDYIKRIYELAGNFTDVPVGEGFNHVYDFNFAKFCTVFNLKPITARSALRLLTNSGYIDYVEDVESRARIMMLADRNELYSLQLQPHEEAILQHILRTSAGIFADYTMISEAAIAYHTSTTEQQVYDTLLMLGRMHVLHYVPRRTTPYILYTTARELPQHITMPHAVYEDMQARMAERIEAMKQFVYNPDICRASTILTYFGETSPEPCGTCDVCRDNRRGNKPVTQDYTELEILRQSIIYAASKPGGTDIADVIAYATIKRAQVISVIRDMADNGEITLNGNIITGIK